MRPETRDPRLECTGLALALALSACATAPPMPASMAEADKLLKGAEVRTGNLRINCSPEDATVILDGVPVGLCSDFKGKKGMDVAKGPRRLEVQKLGFMPYESVVDADGTRISLTVALAPSSLEGGTK